MCLGEHTATRARPIQIFVPPLGFNRSMTTTGWIISIVMLLVGLTGGYLAGRGSTSGHQERRQDDVEREALAYQVSRELAPMNQALRDLEGRVGKMDTAHKHQMDWLISELGSSQQTEREVLAATQRLDTALRTSPKRGTWGELSLRRVLEMSGLTRHIDFTEQLHTGSARPDVVVHLPGDGALVIDAKVPIDAYLRSFDDEGVDLRAHSKAVRSHVNQLANRRYTDVIAGSLDIVLLYMPSEALTSASFEADPNLFEDAVNKGILIVGPSSLLTLLRVIEYAWSRDSLEQDAREILELGRTLADRINMMSEHLGKLGDSLAQTVRNYNLAIGSFEKRLTVTARNIKSLEHSLKPAPSPIDTAVRKSGVGSESEY